MFIRFFVSFFLFVDYIQKIKYIAIRSAGKKKKYERVRERE